MKEISEKTTISIGLAIAVIGTAAMWLTSVSNTVQAHSKQIDAITESRNQAIKEYNNNLQDIKARLIIIEYKLDKRNDK